MALAFEDSRDLWILARKFTALGELEEAAWREFDRASLCIADGPDDARPSIVVFRRRDDVTAGRTAPSAS